MSSKFLKSSAFNELDKSVQEEYKDAVLKLSEGVEEKNFETLTVSEAKEKLVIPDSKPQQIYRGFVYDLSTNSVLVPVSFRNFQEFLNRMENIDLPNMDKNEFQSNKWLVNKSRCCMLFITVIEDYKTLEVFKCQKRIASSLFELLNPDSQLFILENVKLVKQQKEKVEKRLKQERGED